MRAGKVGKGEEERKSERVRKCVKKDGVGECVKKETECNRRGKRRNPQNRAT